MGSKIKVFITSFKSTPQRFRLLLVLCVISSVVIGISNYYIYSNLKQVEKALRIEQAPSIVNSNNIASLLAGGNASIMNVLLTKQESYGKFWDEYRYNMTRVMLYLVTVSKGMTSIGEKEQIDNIMINFAEYENGIGFIRGKAGAVTIDDIAKANTTMKKELLPAAANLDEINTSSLDNIYHSYENKVSLYVFIFVLFSLSAIIILIYSQINIYKTCHRIVNIPLALATLILIILIILSGSSFIRAGSNTSDAKMSFDLIHELMKTKANAFDANSDSSLYLLYTGDKEAQKQLLADFKLKTNNISAEIANNTKNQEIAQSNILTDIQKDALRKVKNEWSLYVDIGNRIKTLELSGNHNQAVGLCVGNSPEEANWQFSKFDRALEELLQLTQNQFYVSTQSALRELQSYTYLLSFALLLVVILSISGIKIRLNEYRY